MSFNPMFGLTAASAVACAGLIGRISVSGNVGCLALAGVVGAEGRCAGITEGLMRRGVPSQSEGDSSDDGGGLLCCCLLPLRGLRTASTPFLALRKTHSTNLMAAGHMR